MQTTLERGMNKRRISVSSKRQITIPIEFFRKLGVDKEVECYMDGDQMIVRAVAPEHSGEFAEEILADLIAQGYQGSELMEKFKVMNRSIRSAASRLMEEADRIAAGEIPSATMDDIFGGED